MSAGHRLKPACGVAHDADRVEVAAVQHLDPHDRALVATRGTPAQRGPVRPEVEPLESRLEGLARVEADDPRPGAADVRLDHEREGDLVERLPELIAMVDDDRSRIARADALEQIELERLRLLAAVRGHRIDDRHPERGVVAEQGLRVERARFRGRGWPRRGWSGSRSPSSAARGPAGRTRDWSGRSARGAAGEPVARPSAGSTTPGARPGSRSGPAAICSCPPLFRDFYVAPIPYRQQ